MNFLELAKERYSERFFDSRPIEQEKLDKMLGLGYPNEKAKANGWHYKRKPIEDFVFEL